MKVPSTAIHTRLLPGMSVRETAHAMGTPKRTQRAATQAPRMSEFPSAST